MSGMQRLYDSEINFVIEAFSDAGFYVTLGDEWNGFQTEGRCSTRGDVEVNAGDGAYHWRRATVRAGCASNHPAAHAWAGSGCARRIPSSGTYESSGPMCFVRSPMDTTPWRQVAPVGYVAQPMPSRSGCIARAPGDEGCGQSATMAPRTAG